MGRIFISFHPNTHSVTRLNYIHVTERVIDFTSDAKRLKDVCYPSSLVSVTRYAPTVRIAPIVGGSDGTQTLAADTLTSSPPLSHRRGPCGELGWRRQGLGHRAARAVRRLRLS